MSARRSRPEAGESLAELLVTIVIMGVAVVGLLGGIGMAAKSSHVHREEASGEGALRNYAEALLDPSVEYQTCATPASYAAVQPAGLPAGYTAEIVAVRYWDGANPVRFVESLAGCPATDNGLQELQLRVSGATGASVETVEIVKGSG